MKKVILTLSLLAGCAGAPQQTKVPHMPYDYLHEETVLAFTQMRQAYDKGDADSFLEAKARKEFLRVIDCEKLGLEQRKAQYGESSCFWHAMNQIDTLSSLSAQRGEIAKKIFNENLVRGNACEGYHLFESAVEHYESLAKNSPAVTELKKQFDYCD